VTPIRSSASRPRRLDRFRLPHPAVIGGTFACCRDRDRVFFDADLAAPTVAEGDAAQVRQVYALVDFAVEIEGGRGGDVEDA
jgi:hypothetical protein